MKTTRFPTALGALVAALLTAPLAVDARALSSSASLAQEESKRKEAQEKKGEQEEKGEKERTEKRKERPARKDGDADGEKGQKKRPEGRSFGVAFKVPQGQAIDQDAVRKALTSIEGVASVTFPEKPPIAIVSMATKEATLDRKAVEKALATVELKLKALRPMPAGQVGRSREKDNGKGEDQPPKKEAGGDGKGSERPPKKDGGTKEKPKAGGAKKGNGGGN